MRKSLAGVVVAVAATVALVVGSAAPASAASVVIDEPPVRAAGPCEGGGDRQCHTVVAGDWLWKLGREVCGARHAVTAAAAARVLYAANRDAIGGNANRLRPGTTLVVPSECLSVARPVVSVAESGTTAAVRPGTRLDVSVTSCGGCGYGWRVVSAPSALRFRTEVTIPDAPQPDSTVVGNARQSVLVFDTVRTGRGTLRLGYFGPGATTPEQVRSIAVTSR